jgi:hypothetical protein
VGFPKSIDGRPRHLLVLGEILPARDNHTRTFAVPKDGFGSSDVGRTKLRVLSLIHLGLKERTQGKSGQLGRLVQNFGTAWNAFNSSS